MIMLMILTNLESVKGVVKEGKAGEDARGERQLGDQGEGERRVQRDGLGSATTLGVLRNV